MFNSFERPPFRLSVCLSGMAIEYACEGILLDVAYFLANTTRPKELDIDTAKLARLAWTPSTRMRQI